MQKAELISEDSIRLLVDGFYDRVRRDTALGPVFENKIGTRFEDWKPHLEKMYAFWSSITLLSGRYVGNPMRKHLDLPPFPDELFDTWLKLFAQTADDVFSPEISQIFKLRSQAIASNLRYALSRPRTN